MNKIYWVNGSLCVEDERGMTQWPCYHPNYDTVTYDYPERLTRREKNKVLGRFQEATGMMVTACPKCGSLSNVSTFTQAVEEGREQRQYNVRCLDCQLEWRNHFEFTVSDVDEYEEVSD